MGGKKIGFGSLELCSVNAASVIPPQSPMRQRTGLRARCRVDWNLILENSFWCMECDLCGGEGARVSERSWTLAARHSWPYLGLLLWSGSGWEVPSRGGIIHKSPTQHHCVGVLHSRRESNHTSSLYHGGEGSDFVLHLGAKPQFRISNFLGCPRWGLGRGTSWSELEWCFFSRCMCSAWIGHNKHPVWT